MCKYSLKTKDEGKTSSDSVVIGFISDDHKNIGEGIVFRSPDSACKQILGLHCYFNC